MESFPRGGKKPAIKRSSNTLFDEQSKSNKKHKTQIKTTDNNISMKEINFIATAERLSNATLREGMTILGRISRVSEYDLIVSIPGGILGRVEVTNLSESYTNLLQNIISTKTIQSNEFKPLPDLYNPGDYVVCYVKSIDLQGKWLYSLSLEPQLINQNVYNSYLVKNAKIVCTIKSIEDHGYVVDTGIANVRAFLATENVDKEKKYFPGNQLLCIIKEIETADYSFVIKLSAKKRKINNVIVHDIASLDVITPGTKLSLCVTKVLSNGLQVTFGKDNIGYINQIYLNNPLSMYTENMEVTGILLYILPTVKLAYFSLLTDESEKERLSKGDIIRKAKVLYRESNGIILNISKSGLHGFVSLLKTNVPFAKIPTEFKQGSTHKCRILAYNWIEHLYVCTMEDKILKQKYFSASDLNCGDIITVTITDIDTSNGYIHVQAGNISGFVPPIHVSDSGLSALNKLKIGDSIEARVLHLKTSSYNTNVMFTLKQSLIKSKLPVLHDIHDAQCGSKYHGTITKIDKNGLLVRFYGAIKGWVPRSALNGDTYNMNWNYSIGQTLTVCTESIEKNENKMKLKVVTEEQKQQAVRFSIGEMIEGTVTESSIKGVYLRIHGDDENVTTGFLPAGHMAPCIEIGSLLASRCTPGDVISALVFATKPGIILSRTFVTQEQYRSFDLLKVGDCIPCTIRDISQDGVRVVLPIENYSKLGFVSYKNINNFELLHVNQILFVKITAINMREKYLTLTMALKDVWDSPLEKEVKMMTAVDVLSLYLNRLSELAKNTFYDNKPISLAVLGQKITGTVEKITKHGLVLRLDNHLTGTVRKDHYSGEFRVGDKVSGTILWKNYVHELVDVSLLPRIINGISSKQKTLPELPTGVVLRAEILMITKWLILVLIKRNGAGYLAVLPVRRHLNDISPDLTPYMIHARIRLYVIMTGNESDIVPVCMLKSAFETKISKEATVTTKKKLKRKKISEQHNVTLTNPTEQASEKDNKKEYEVEIKEEETRIKDIDEYSELSKDSSDESEKGEDKPIADKLHIQECGFSWDDKANLATSAETSSDDEEEPEEEPKRKKKLSAAERREQEREKERKIRQREEALASNKMPNSTDQFDKLVLSNPDSSLVWLQYMAYHLQATEIDKARAIAKRAIKTINFREENERLNVWNAWLNLESRFGTLESLNNVFQEAVQTNDAFRIYTHMLTVHADAGKKIELEKLIDTMIGKFKQNPQTWINCGAALLKIGLKEKSRHIMQRAVQSLPASQHVNLLVRFANLENKLGDKERAQTLFEHILSSYPKRVDVWSCYVDCLIKSEDIDIARRVLERACVQTLPARKMKTLFTKFKSFEEKYGTPEAVARIVQMAAEYVEKQCNI
ncbi:protein RRP5 homolog isoform X1 [Formica exsecta]|uniref:protein RRP5 homolog isoform X1 n=1 Tax=Formica exsecta TaxID=72781 RepID=UPI00114320F0|nr:protein RRP5 homolog isoform X1 [Formica exsecta]XP_029666725.1 protein RRP5 homolog isoform X1 [Formica exsecta]XP_029666726.1 protein RRP5 homolog isoform X2 [Formica exsecta]XP_029666727.1 protein RRP5 homolog isoform X1 [Formica exsecta]